MIHKNELTEQAQEKDSSGEKGDATALNQEFLARHARVVNLFRSFGRLGKCSALRFTEGGQVFPGYNFWLFLLLLGLADLSGSLVLLLASVLRARQDFPDAKIALQLTGQCNEETPLAFSNLVSGASRSA